jgi:hypothetical protein
MSEKPTLAERIAVRMKAKGWTARAMLKAGGCPIARMSYFENQFSRWKSGVYTELPADVAEVVKNAFKWKRL